MSNSTPRDPSRRDFLRASGAAVATTIAAPAILSSSAVAGRRAPTIKFALVGCGGRGTDAALRVLLADPDVQLTAMGDAFANRIEGSLNALKGSADVAKRIDVPASRCFVGLDCYKKVLDSGIDAVVFASPPGFRPREIRAGLEAGKHVFAEKPTGTDVAGALSVMESASIADQKKLAFVTGFCWRYDTPRREFYRRVHGGALGDIRYVHATYVTGPVKPMPKASDRPAGMSDVEWQIRNWYNFVWLSGDGLVEQACHSVDKVMWAMKDVPPLKCIGTGGRNNPNNEGNIFDHIDVFYEWADGARATMAQRQIAGCYSDNSDQIAGAKGHGTIKGQPVIKAEQEWRWEGPAKSMYQIEMDEFIASIRSGKLINDGKRSGQSTLAAVMGRMAAYTGQEITWDFITSSKENLFPNPLEWDMALPTPPMAVPGVTRPV